MARRPVKDYGVVDIGPFKADVQLVGDVWMFRPYRNENPRDGAAIEMNALIRDIGRIWTPVPDPEVEKLEKLLGAGSRESRTWRPMESAPRDATWIEARLPGEAERREFDVVVEVHWGEDLSGENQPPFRGWFAGVHNTDGKLSHFTQVYPIEWRPK